MTLPDELTVGVIGAGAVGTALAFLLQNLDHEVGGIATRTKGSLDQSLHFLNLNEDQGHTNLGPWCKTADLLLLTVPDDRIALVATELSEKDLLSENTLYIHCSGAYTSDTLLSPLKHRAKNRRIGSFHPLQTVPSPEAGTSAIPDAWIGIEGASDVINDLHSLAENIGAQPFEVPENKKTLYHLAAVFACNHVMGLLSIAERLMEDVTSEIENPIEPLAPLIEHSIENSLASSPSKALTGPAVRGDVDTIHTHLDALSEFDSDCSDLYTELTRYCFRIAVDRGDLSEEDMNSFLSQIH